MSAATHKHVLMEAGEQLFAVPAESVGEILALSPLAALPNSAPWLRGVLNRRGKVTPVIDLHWRLHGQAARDQLLHRRCIIVLELGADACVGAIVDRVIDVVAVEPSQFQPLPTGAATPWTTRAVQLADGIAFQFLPDVRLLGEVGVQPSQAA